MTLNSKLRMPTAFRKNCFWWLLRICLATGRLTRLMALGCIGLAGCSEQKMADVAGRIVYAEDDAVAADLAGFRVSFFCFFEGDDGKKKRITATGLVQEDATFTLSTYEAGDGVVLGTHQVAVTPPVLFGDNVKLSKPIIDPRFSRPDQSGLTAEVDDDTEVVLKVQRAR